VQFVGGERDAMVSCQRKYYNDLIFAESRVAMKNLFSTFYNFNEGI